MPMFDRLDIEEIILGMADIVRENRDLRYELERMYIQLNKNDEFFRNIVKSSQKADRDFLKTILENSLTGGNVNALRSDS